MKSRLMKIHNYLTSLNKYKLILFGVFSILLCSLFVSFISSKFFNRSLTEGFSDFKSAREAFLLGVLLAPFLETLVLQAAIIETAKKRVSPPYACLLSAFVFALVHFYNIFYFFYGILSGLIFAYLYYIGSLTSKGFILTLSVHMFYNFIVFVLSNW